MHTATVELPFVPAAVTGEQSYPVLQSEVFAQFTRQTQPLSSSAQEDPWGQFPELPQESVQMPSGNWLPSSQRRSSQSMFSTHGPPTRELSFPAVPAGRESPQPIHDIAAISDMEAMDNPLIIA